MTRFTLHMVAELFADFECHLILLGHHRDADAFVPRHPNLDG